jgi:hypothetical protein
VKVVHSQLLNVLLVQILTHHYHLANVRKDCSFIRMNVFQAVHISLKRTHKINATPYVLS